ncbi:MAG: type I-E CRISPR-associated endonuclease Cas1 [Actinobacteria bacterium]|uniref:Unannotated protein n=1 Tax=freshwater metagenome TaxID=449393 RepID=A0A6J7S3T4_9ZZZZ|nr:type I-E CRISPR-associated endonuclease Cas1 [Actinomycetota bacterium]
MAYGAAALNLRIPSITHLGRVEDRVSFLFLDQCRIEQTRTGVESWQEEEGELWRTTIPAGNLSVLALGPGVSITTPALTTLHRSGTTVILTSGDGLVAYSVGRPLTSSGRWAAAQARIWVDPGLRRAAAVSLYVARFPDQEMPPGVSLAVLRGIEGHKVKSTYQSMAKVHGVKNFKRISKGATDPVNIALNIGNSILYGLAASVTAALSLNPALGFIHEGHSAALLFDLADVYKCEVTIPAAFSVATSDDPIADVSRAVRREIHRRRLLHAMFALAQDVLTPGLKATPDADMLLGDNGQLVPGHTNWHGR